ncbi:MAG: 50S ribosomal protein L3 [bacterium]
MKFILGKKLGMSQIFNEKGNFVPVTLIEAGPCQITQIKDKAVQVGFIKKTKRIKKTEKGKEFKYLREFRIQNPELKTGDMIDVSAFQEGDMAKISGISKGKGFQGVVKRWGFHGRPTTHGMKHEGRTPGSVGCSGPERVIKGKKLAGHYGACSVSVKNLLIVKIDKENNLIAVRGAVPGPKGALLEISI